MELVKEYLYIVVEQWLYGRGVYPQDFFNSYDKYGQRIQISRSPLVQKYIQDFLHLLFVEKRTIPFTIQLQLKTNDNDNDTLDNVIEEWTICSNIMTSSSSSMVLEMYQKSLQHWIQQTITYPISSSITSSSLHWSIQIINPSSMQSNNTLTTLHPIYSYGKQLEMYCKTN